MTHYDAQHPALFRSVAEILVRDYIAPSETADTVADKVEAYNKLNVIWESLVLMEPSELAALIADVEGYEKRWAPT